MSLDPADKTRTFTDRFREVWREREAKNRIAPLVGLGRFIFVAETDEEALTIGRRAYPVWHRSFNYLFYQRGGKGPVHQRPAELDGLIKVGQGIAGSPVTVTAFLQDQMAHSGLQLFGRTISLSAICRRARLNAHWNYLPNTSCRN